MILKTVIFISETMATTLSFLANFTLIYLIQKKTKEDLKPFSKILRQNSFVDMFFASTLGLTFLELEIDHGEYILLLNGPLKNIPHPWNGLLILLYIFGLYFCLFSAIIPFCYRYVLIVKGNQLSTTKFYILYLLTGTSAFTVTLWVYFIVWPSIGSEKRQEFLYAIDEFWIDENGNYPIFLAEHFTNISFPLIMIYVVILISIEYTLIAYFCIKTVKHLSQFKTQMSTKNQQLQKQLTYTLLTQALAPFAIAIFPALIIFADVAFHPGINHLGVIMMSMISWVAVLNPCCAIFFVGPYRDAILRRKQTSNLTPENQAPTSRWGLSRDGRIEP